MLVTQSCLTLLDPMDCSPPGVSAIKFSRQDYQNGLLFPSPGDLPNPGIGPGSPPLQVDSLPSDLPGKAFLINILVCLSTYAGILFLLIGSLSEGHVYF